MPPSLLSYRFGDGATIPTSPTSPANLYGGGPVNTRCRWPGTTTGLSKIRDPVLQGQGCRQNVVLIEEHYLGGLRKRDDGPRMSAAIDVRSCPAIELGTTRDCDEQDPLAPQTVRLPVIVTSGRASSMLLAGRPVIVRLSGPTLVAGAPARPVI